MNESQFLKILADNDQLVIEREFGGNPQPRRTTTGKRISPWRNERQFMFAVLDMAKRNAAKDARWGLLYHIQNERGHHNRVTAGVPDLHLPIASADGRHCGLYIELKITGRKPSKAQREYIAKLRNAGNRVAIIWDSVAEVEQAISEYLKGVML